MNKRQKLVQERFLDNEEAVIKSLEKVYGTALEDITKKAQALQDDINRLGTLAKLATDEDEKAQILSMQQAKVYQKQYQDALKKQVGSILDNMQVEEFKTVSGYLQTCYEDAFVGTMFDLQGQGIPLCFPLDQESMVRAVQLDSKISEGLYNYIGENVADLKKHITSEVARGIATGAAFSDIARQLRTRMTGDYNKAGGMLYRSKLIARTEGHRIQCQATMDACHKAKEKGADVVKQWDATLDAKTRDSHARVDGEIRELDKPFSNGLMFPGDPDGGAAEVCNCRCALFQRAKWNLDEDELKILQERAEFFGLDKSEQFEEYKKNYLKASEVLTNTSKSDIMSSGAKYGAYNDKNDPEGRKRKAHAVLYYDEIRNSSTEHFVNAVSKNTNIPKETVEKAYKHIFVDDHEFDEDYDMAESFRRLRTNDKIQEHDKILVFHEALEYDIMKKNPNMSYTEAHTITEQTYNYAKALLEWKKKGGK